VWAVNNIIEGELVGGVVGSASSPVPGVGDGGYLLNGSSIALAFLLDRQEPRSGQLPRSVMFLSRSPRHSPASTSYL
jgi:hypothetical protein